MIYINRIINFIQRPYIKLALTITLTAVIGLFFYNIGIEFGKTLRYII